MPLLEELAAPPVVTRECFCGSASCPADVCDRREVLGLGNMLFVYKFWKVYGLSVLNI